MIIHVLEWTEKKMTHSTVPLLHATLLTPFQDLATLSSLDVQPIQRLTAIVLMAD